MFQQGTTSPWNLRNGERLESETQKQRETERQIQSRRGSRPSHNMETKDQRGNPSPSREEVKEEEEEGGLSPPRFRWRRNAAGGHHHHRDLHQHLCHLHQRLHHLLLSIFSGPLSHNPLYPLLEHGALCFILLSNDVFPSYDV